jgi:hypothetical protein
MAACPPGEIVMDDGPTVHAGPIQLWLWQCLLDYLEGIERIREKWKADKLVLVSNGDALEGHHHGTYQIMGAHPGIQRIIAERVWAEILRLEPDALHFVRGTGVHVGGSAKDEESLAKHLGAVQHENGNYSTWELSAEIDGVRISCLHHGRTGYREWTRANASLLLAADIFMKRSKEAAELGRINDYPHMAYRSHFHYYADSGMAHPVRVIQTPAFQMLTEHGHRRVPEELPHVGACYAIIEDGHIVATSDRQAPWVQRPERTPVWRPAWAA